MDIQGFALKDIKVELETKAHEETARLRAQEEQCRLAFDQGFSAGLLEGTEKGIAEGFKKGEDTGKSVKAEEILEYDRLTRVLSQLLSDVKCLTEKKASEAEQNVLKIAIAIAERILRKEIADNSEAVLGFVAEGLKTLAPADSVCIRIHPQDAAFLTQKTPELLKAIEGISSLRFEIDPALLPGDAIVESKERSVDARLKSQLKIMEKHLLSKSESEKPS
ncbi:MAG: FliH/SctL family protein [Nitrospirota bacterium]